MLNRLAKQSVFACSSKETQAPLIEGHEAFKMLKETPRKRKASDRVFLERARPAGMLKKPMPTRIKRSEGT